MKRRWFVSQWANNKVEVIKIFWNDDLAWPGFDETGPGFNSTSLERTKGRSNKAARFYLFKKFIIDLEHLCLSRDISHPFNNNNNNDCCVRRVKKAFRLCYKCCSDLIDSFPVFMSDFVALKKYSFAQWQWSEVRSEVRKQRRAGFNDGRRDDVSWWRFGWYSIDKTWDFAEWRWQQIVKPRARVSQSGRNE